MSENLTGQEAVGMSETRRLIETATTLLPALSPSVIDLSHVFENNPEAISILLTASTSYRVDRTIVTLNTDDACGFPALDIELRTPDGSGEGYESESCLIFLDTLEVTCSKYSIEPEHQKSIFDLRAHEVRDVVNSVSSELQFDQIVGDDLLTQARYDRFMKILAECTPDNLVDSAE